MTNTKYLFCRKACIVMLSLMVTLGFGSCVHHEYYDLVEGQIVVNLPDYEPIDGETLPVLDVLDENGNSVASPSVGVPHSLPTGTYTVVVVTDKSSVEVEKTTIHTSLLADDGRLTTHAPFYGGVGTTRITDGQVVKLDIQMKPMTRKVELLVECQEVDMNYIKQMEATVRGVAFGSEIASGFGKGLIKGTLPEYYVKTNLAQGDNHHWQTAFSLLGIDGDANQSVGIAVETIDGKMHHIALDAKQNFPDFNEGDPKEPLVLKIKLVLSPKISGTIESWTPGITPEIPAT